ncbi:MAG: ACP S-malonyltransferase, partial [Deltaproteobacteria bacterium]
MNTKYGIIFSGQGSQFVGMGKDIIEKQPHANVVFALAETITGIPIKKICLEDPNEELNLTINSQLAIFLVEAIIFDLFTKSVSILPTVTAGHSLGEYGALYCAGVWGNITNAVRIVHARAKRHQEAFALDVGAMMVIIGATFENINQVCAEISHDGFVAEIANINSAKQIVISGHKEAVLAVGTKTKDSFNARTIFLPINVPCHSSLMKNAAELFATDLATSVVYEPQIPVISNCDPSQLHCVNMTKELLMRQMISP